MKLKYLLILIFLGFPKTILAVDTPSQVSDYVSETLNIITILSTAAAVFFLIWGGYKYISSAGNPNALEEGKKIIKNSLIGLALVLSASLLISLLSSFWNSEVENNGSANLPIVQIEAQEPSENLEQILIDTIAGLLKNIIESITKPVVDAIMSFLASTPLLSDNSTIVNFWKLMVAITDGLFVLVVALLGLRLMSSRVFGFEEIDLSQILPRIALGFLAANASLFLCDLVIKASNALTSGVIESTGGLTHAFFEDVVQASNIGDQKTSFVILIFLLIFEILAIVLLFAYISRLIIISLAGVLSPFIFLLWTLPKGEDFAITAIKGYLVSVFTIFVNVVTIKLAGSFLTLPEQTDNSMITIAVATGLLITFLKTPNFMLQLVLATSQAGVVK